jgi:Icc-related predicted phosphoesterase
VVRVVCISDTHGHEIDVPDGDLLIHAGDLTMGGSYRECQRGLTWLASWPHKSKIFVPGNNDRAFADQPTELISSARNRRVHVLIDAGCRVQGHYIYGTPWLSGVPGWAFDCTDRLEKLQASRDAIPPMVDILVTHCPPQGIMDWCPARFPGDPESAGCDLLPRGDPTLHVFGHIHEGYGILGAYVNAAICTAEYEPTNLPIVIDL